MRFGSSAGVVIEDEVPWHIWHLVLLQNIDDLRLLVLASLLHVLSLCLPLASHAKASRATMATEPEVDVFCE